MPLINSLNFGEVYFVLYWKDKKHLSVKYSSGKSKVNDFNQTVLKSVLAYIFFREMGK